MIKILKYQSFSPYLKVIWTIVNDFQILQYFGTQIKVINLSLYEPIFYLPI